MGQTRQNYKCTQCGKVDICHSISQYSNEMFCIKCYKDFLEEKNKLWKFLKTTKKD